MNDVVAGLDKGLLHIHAKPSMYINAELINSNNRNVFRWNYIRNSNIYFGKNPPENVVWQMSSILFRPRIY